MNDSIQINLGMLQSQVAVSDSFTLKDNIQFVDAPTRVVVNDRITVKDAVVSSFQSPMGSTNGDNLLISDSVLSLLTGALVLGDSLVLSDLQNLCYANRPILSDAISLLDVITLFLAIDLSVQSHDSFSLNDAVVVFIAESFDNYIRRFLNDS